LRAAGCTKKSAKGPDFQEATQHAASGSYLELSTLIRSSRESRLRAEVTLLITTIRSSPKRKENPETNEGQKAAEPGGSKEEGRYAPGSRPDLKKWLKRSTNFFCRKIPFFRPFKNKAETPNLEI
jgi:hypothetical protein